MLVASLPNLLTTNMDVIEHELLDMTEVQKLRRADKDMQRIQYILNSEENSDTKIGRISAITETYNKDLPF